MKRDNKLFKRKGGNRYLKRNRRLERTTLILGAKCEDGVILVGDRKVGSEAAATYISKIRRCGAINWAVFGAAGIGTLFEEFLTLLPQRVGNHFSWINYENQKLISQHRENFPNSPNEQLPPAFTYTTEDFKHDCVELLTEMRRRYSVAFENEWCNLQILIGTKEDSDAKLYYLESENCLPAEVPSIVFIGQSQLSEIFRKCWDENMTMQQTAKLGILAVKYIEQEGMSDNIGVGNLQPQVWFIPNDQLPPREILDDELSALVLDADQQLEDLHRRLHSLFRS